MRRACQFVLAEQLLLLLLLLLFRAASWTAGAEDKPDCSAQVVQLAPCLSFVSGQDTEAPETCCDALSTVLVETPSCICELIGGGANASARTGLPSINLTLVKQLPKECGVQEQVKIDESQCPGHGNHTLAPPGAPGTTSAPGANSGSPMFVPAPSFCTTLLLAILTFTAGEYYELTST